MSSNTSVGLSKTYWAFWTAFILLSLWGISDSELSTKQTKQRVALLNLDAPSVVPGNLRRAADDLKAALRSHLPHVPADEITKLKAWKELDATLKECARQLELRDSQSQELDEFLQQRQLWVLGGSFFCAIAWVLVSLADQRKVIQGLPVERRVKVIIVLTGCIAAIIGFGYGAYSMLSIVNDMAKDASDCRLWGLKVRDFGLLCALPAVLLMAGIVIWTLRFLRQSGSRVQ